MTALAPGQRTNRKGSTMAAMRATWTGAIAFGLVSVNCKLYKSTSSHDVSFKQVHKTDGGAIRYVKTCADCACHGIVDARRLRMARYR